MKHGTLYFLLILSFFLLSSALIKAQHPNSCDIAAVRAAFNNAGCIELSGPNPGCSMYFLATQSMTGNQAQTFAQTLGANLVSIQSAAENLEVFTGLQTNYPGYNPGDVYWIGANDIANEGTFVWYDQNPFSYTNWDSGEPNNQTSSCCSLPWPFTCNNNNCNGGEDCVQLRSNGLWNDLPCANSNGGSIIEVNLCPQITTSPDETICFGGSATISASTILGSAPYTYAWSNVSSGPSITVSPTTTTIYSVTVTGRYGCTATEDVTITVDVSQNTNGCDLTAVRTAFTNAGCFELSGCNPGCSMYFFIPQSMTGNQAQAFAQTLGANLVSIQSPAENLEVVTALNAHGLGGVIWIGFNDIASENNFVWYDQSPVNYTNWNPNTPEPNNVTPSCCSYPWPFNCSGSQCNGEDCTQMYPNGQWNDLPCGDQNTGSVIEVNLCPLITTSPDATVCLGASVTISASTIYGSLPYTYEWPGGSAGTSLTVSPTNTTTYSVTVTGRYGCSEVGDITVTVYEVNADAGLDVEICKGDSIQLNATGGDRYSWNPTTGLNNPMIPNPVASPTTTTNYIVEVLEVQGNQVTNGDFQSGNQGFSSNYGYTSTDLRPEGRYSVTSNPNGLHSGFTGVDHTSGSGNLMAVNGSGTPNQSVWCQSIPVSPGTDYEFSTWVSSLAAGSPARLQFSINGTTIGSIFTAPSATGVWQQFFAVWNSGTATSVTICIVNQNTATGGNDFGLDDITFSEVCKGYDTVTVTVNPLPIVDAGPDVTICFGSPTQLTATGADTYLWSPSAGLSSTTIANPMASPSTATLYHVLGVDLTGCQSEDSITVNVNPLPILNLSGLRPEYCADEPLVGLTGNPNGGTFSGPGVIGGQFSAGGAGTGTHNIKYEYTDANGCTDSTFATITVNALPELEITGIDSGYCSYIDRVRVVLTPIGGTFFGPATTSVTFNPNAAGVGSHEVFYTYTDTKGCDDTISAMIEVYDVPVGQLKGVNAICFDSTDGYAYLQLTGGTPDYNYVWSGFIPNNTTPIDGDTLLNIGRGNYSVTATDQNGCEFIGDIHISEPPQLQLDIQAERDSAFLGQITTLWAKSNADSISQYIWGHSDSIVCVDRCKFAEAEMYGNQVYYLEIRDTNNCAAYDEITLYLKPPKIHFIPNIFTPNGDNLNDNFVVEALGVRDFHMQVYDRWGSKIYDGRDRETGWDGTFKGRLCDPGVYIYKVTLIYYDSVIERYNGSITLIR